MNQNVNAGAAGITLSAGTLISGGQGNFGGANGKLTLNGGLFAWNGSRTWANAVVMGGNFGISNVNANASTFSGGVDLGSGVRTITNNASQNLTFSGVINNTGGLRLEGSGTGVIILSGANTYTGKTTVAGGTLRLTNSGTAGTNTSDLDVTGGLLDLGTRTRTNAAFLISGGTITNGTLQATSYALQGGTIISNATLGTGTATVTTGTTTLNGLLNAATLNVNSGTLTAGSSGRFTGTPTVTVSNGATLNLAGNETFGSLAGGGSVSNSAGRITAGGNNSSTTFSGVLSGAGELTKTGIGRLSLSGSSSYNGATAVSAGELNLSGGSIANSAVTVASGASLSGYGSVGTIGGAGAINPGNSPGILTTPQVDPSGGTDFNFEMTGIAPTYNNASNSVNDVIRITGAPPFSPALAAGNGVFIYFSGAALFTGSTAVQYQGGFFTDQSASFASSISGATYNYYFANSNGPTTYNGVSYYNRAQYESLVLGTNMLITVSTVAQTANFGSGNVNGQVMQIDVIPEPSTYALLVLAVAGWGAHAWRRRKQVS
jgi:autotransporter-associated beta strand protein